MIVSIVFLQAVIDEETHRTIWKRHSQIHQVDIDSTERIELLAKQHPET